jgi:hypothetical protein
MQLIYINEACKIEREHEQILWTSRHKCSVVTPGNDIMLLSLEYGNLS